MDIEHPEETLDVVAFRDTAHIPPDAGMYAEKLSAIMARIPNGWGKWISCGPGWYGILAELDDELSALDPNYEVHQVKEKYGTLRYYADYTKKPQCCTELERQHRHIEEHDWYEAWEQHRETDKCVKAWEKIENERERFDLLIEKAENLSAQTCENTGEAGLLMEDSGWYQTLDPLSAPRGWVVAELDETYPNLVAAELDGADDVDSVTAAFEEVAKMYSREVPALRGHVARLRNEMLRLLDLIEKHNNTTAEEKVDNENS